MIIRFHNLLCEWKKMFDPNRVIVLKLIPSVLYYFYNRDFQLSSRTTKTKYWTEISFSWLTHLISKQHRKLFLVMLESRLYQSITVLYYSSYFFLLPNNRILQYNVLWFSIYNSYGFMLNLNTYELYHSMIK